MSCCEAGFRLATPSECSVQSKARIDALFDDSRSSVCSSSGWCGRSLLLLPPTGPSSGSCCPVDERDEIESVKTTTMVLEQHDEEREQRRVNSAVQARIEAMFASVEADAGPGESAAAILSDLTQILSMCKFLQEVIG
ncbi:hypothetical protein QAD02_014877 [Eretmocerus hayati]|uniref:Uncharacterized protein n=1 Tax=Eretmocerus hayati TaxID=131215 RepID=A0ACC2P683_9HYME|nr:hypothetical protein QAD02_014877 [Eretmocerus hayati]